MRVAADFAAAMPVLAPQQQTRRKWLKVGIGLTVGMVLGTVLIAGAAAAFLWFTNRTRSTRDSSDGRGSQVSPIREPQVMSLVDTAFTLNAAQTIDWNFNVPANATNVRVEGSFAASGDAASDVEVYVLNDDDFVSWRNGQSVNALYKSGRRPRGILHAVLPVGAGTYHLVFNNKFSLSTPKAITANIRLRYTL